MTSWLAAGFGIQAEENENVRKVDIFDDRERKEPVSSS
jgi:hypothetical protein